MLVSSRRPRAERKSASFAPRASCRPRLAQVAGDGVRRLLAERHDALLAALAAHAHELLLEVDVAEVEPDRLGAAQPGRVDELDERAVAQRRAAPSPSSASRSSSISCRFGASGSRCGRCGDERRVRHAGRRRA